LNAKPAYPALVEACKQALSDAISLETEVTAAAGLLSKTLVSGGKLLACGNGGSAADASHLIAEILIRFRDERRPFPAISLNADGAVLTAGGNDYGYDEIFARQIRGLGRPGDALIVFTSSGKSPNIVRALGAAREVGMKSIALLGRDGGACAGKADVEIIVRNDVTARIQEVHHFLLHALCEMIEVDLKSA
jgi:D-sedoheptulose 7-phosphate isomerase